MTTAPRTTTTSFLKFIDLTASTPAKLFLILLSSELGDWALNNLWKIPFPWFYVGSTVVILGWVTLVKHYGQRYAGASAFLALTGASWIISLCMGRVVYGLVGNVPLLFYSIPYAMIILGVYLVVLSLFVKIQSRVDVEMHGLRARIGLP